jgi:hypothetical protein
LSIGKLKKVDFFALFFSGKRLNSFGHFYMLQWYRQEPAKYLPVLFFIGRCRDMTSRVPPPPKRTRPPKRAAQEKPDLSADALALLSLPAPEGMAQVLAGMGVPAERRTNRMGIVAGMVAAAQAGDLAAARLVLDWTHDGEGDDEL